MGTPIKIVPADLVDGQTEAGTHHNGKFSEPDDPVDSEQCRQFAS